MSEPGWITQWGSCSLGERGYSPIEILRHYYGDSLLYQHGRGDLPAFRPPGPAMTLTIGASGQKVRQLQEQLDAIATVYTAIPRVAADGIYGPDAAAAVREFQSIFGLPPTGVTDFATWYKVVAYLCGRVRDRGAVWGIKQRRTRYNRILLSGFNDLSQSDFRTAPAGTYAFTAIPSA